MENTATSPLARLRDIIREVRPKIRSNDFAQRDDADRLLDLAERRILDLMDEGKEQRVKGIAAEIEGSVQQALRGETIPASEVEALLRDNPGAVIPVIGAGESEITRLREAIASAIQIGGIWIGEDGIINHSAQTAMYPFLAVDHPALAEVILSAKPTEAKP